MFFDKLLQPAIFILNKLPFKLKIIVSASTLFMLLLLPAYTLLKNYSGQKSLLLLLGFVAIILASFYIFVAFYHSIAKSLKLLEFASTEITKGKTNISLPSNGKDEIGSAIIAFNTMSEELNKNISFLNCYKMAIDESSIVSKTDTNGIITYVNELFCEVSGYTREELIGSSHNIIRHPDMPKEAFKNMWYTIKNKKIWKGMVKNKKKNGGYYIVDATILPILDEHNNILEYVAVRHDVTELEENREKLAKQKIDFLTNLPNKNALVEDIKKMKRPIAFYLNIDNFMKLNDFYGNKLGDRVLVHMANILRETTIQKECNIYRIYNDEFLVLCEEDGINIDNYEAFFSKLIKEIEVSTIDCDKSKCSSCDSPECISFTISGGVSHYGLDENYENLSIYASIARNIAKSENRKFLLYDHDMQRDEDYAQNIRWIKQIKRAISDNRFLPYFQPIIDNTTGKVIKYEALVRMIDDKGKVISPFFFLEIAKKANLYSTITRIMIDKTLEVFKNAPKYECSINLSTEDIMKEKTRAYIYNKLESYPHPHKVVFEITESEDIIDFKTVNRFIKKVREYGVKISIDDFGTGYANFEYILNLDVDYIKIDGGLIKNIDVDEESRIMVEAIIAFSKKLGIKTIVEFVHSEDVYHEVVSLGADYSQGYYIGKPKSSLIWWF